MLLLALIAFHDLFIVACIVAFAALVARPLSLYLDRPSTIPVGLLSLLALSAISPLSLLLIV